MKANCETVDCFIKQFNEKGAHRFEFDGKIHIGTILVVDYRYGEDAECFSLKNAGYTYDFEVKNENMLYKHLPEFVISSVENESGGHK